MLDDVAGDDPVVAMLAANELAERLTAPDARVDEEVAVVRKFSEAFGIGMMTPTDDNMVIGNLVAQIEKEMKP